MAPMAPVLAKTIRKGMWLIRRPQPEVFPHPSLAHLGTPYGGWHFVHTESLKNSVVLSAGVGEDISFDVMLASVYDCRIVLLDPTPRAVKHYETVAARVGSHADTPYFAGGSQPEGSYELSSVGSENLLLEPSALWDQDGEVTFYPPADSSHVSYSITDYQNGRRKVAEGLTVPAVRYATICEQYFAGNAPALVKLDIEGAEIEVLPDILINPPQQILIEFDELNLRDGRAIRRWKHAHRLLLDSGFVLAHFERFNFSYVHRGLY